MDPIDPALFQRDDLQPVLAERDIGALYQVLKNDAGLSQRQIAARTGQSQSEVADIISGRRRVVDSYRLLVRIAEGFGIPRGRMGLAHRACDCTCTCAYRGDVTVIESEEAEGMLRRQFDHLLAVGAAAVFGGVVPEVGALATDLPTPGAPAELPDRIGAADVAVLGDHRVNLRTVARTHGGQARAAVALTDWADRWLDADASDTTRRALLAELAELHTITAYCCHDGGATARALYHFGRAVELATDAGDAYLVAYALRHAALMLIERYRPNEALKATQLASARLLDALRDDPRAPALGAEVSAVSAFALSRLDDSPAIQAQAREHLNRARNGWAPPDTHARARMDLMTGWTWLHCGQLDTAEAAATVSAQTYATDRRGGVLADLTRARLHVISGDPGALRLAEAAITATTRTRSGVARQIWLPPLADALEARRGADYADLARQARRVATTRA